MYFKTDAIGTKIHNNQRIVSEKVQESMNRLSTGLRINSAKDDAAGLQISERLKSQSNGAKASLRNINDSISLVRTADGSLNSMSDMLQRLKELSIQAQNGTYSLSDRNSLQNEANTIIDSINKLTLNTTFNNKQIFIPENGLRFDGTNAVTIPYDPIYNISDKVTISAWFNPETVSGTIFNKGSDPETFAMGLRNGKPVFYREEPNGTNRYIFGSTNISTNEWHHIAVVDNGLEMNIYIDGVKDPNVLTSTGWSAGTDTSNVLIGYKGGVGSESANDGNFKGIIKDVRISNVAKTEEEIKQEMFQEASINDPNLVGHWKLNEGSGTNISDSSIYNNPGTSNANWIPGSEIGKVHTGYESDNEFKMTFSPINSGTLGLSGLNLSVPNSVKQIDDAINRISTERAKYGSYENRLNTKIDNLTNLNTNIETSNARIREADFSNESSIMIKEQIKLQTSIQMLQKYNSNRQNSLSLLVN